jgi:hypothetical protein
MLFKRLFVMQMQLLFVLALLQLPLSNLFAQAPYCMPQANWGCSDDWIDDVYTTGGVTNFFNYNTGCNGTYNGTFYTSTYTYFSAKTCSQMQGQQINLHMQCGTTWVQGFRVWIDWNKNNSFADPGEDVYVSPNASFSIFTAVITVPASATIGTTRMRVQCRYNNMPILTGYCGTTNDPGETEDYNFTVLAAAPCSGTPTSGTATGTSVCVGSSSIVSVSGFTAGTGITFQWQQLNGATWANVVGGSGATTATYITPNLFANTQYKCLVKCTNSNITSSTPAYTVVVNPPLSTAPTSNAYIFGVTTDVDFNTASNWYTYTTASGYGIATMPPNSANNVIIAPLASCIKAKPVLLANASVNNLELKTGAVLNLDYSSLSIAGGVLGTGQFVGSLGASLEILGTTNSTISFDQSNPSVTNVLQNLTLSGTGSITLANQLNISPGVNAGTVMVGSNKTLLTGGYLRLQSDADGTARIAESGGTISGAITQERFIPSKWSRKWSFLACPVSQSLATAWQQQIHITGPGTGGSMCTNYTNAGSMLKHSNGFDVTQTQNPSFYTYDPIADNFIPNTNGTNSFTLTPGEGYMVLVRGDRNDPTNGGCALLAADDQAQNSAIPVVLSAKGIVGQGTISKTLLPGYNLVGNPYPCELDFTDFVSDASNSSLIENKYWTYYPTSSNYTFSTYSAGTSINDATPQIANGQSFLVHNLLNAPVSISFKEAHKSGIVENGNFKINKEWKERVRVKLLNQQAIRLDEIVIRFSVDSFKSDQLNALDVVSLNQGDQWIQSRKDTTALAIQTRSNLFLNDTISLTVHAKNAGHYSLDFSEYQGLSNAEIYLLDHQESLIQDIKALPSYAFNAAANTTSANRFQLLFKALPNNISSHFAHNLCLVYPNPAKELLVIDASNMSPGAYQIKLRNSTGHVVLEESGFYENGNKIELSLRELQIGMYTLELMQQNGARWNQKVVKY